MGQLAYDVGAHCGSDTAHYLNLGYDVLAIEADPTLAAGLRNRFAVAIQNGRLRVLQCGISENEGEQPFYLCQANSEWNSFESGWAEAHGATSAPIAVQCRRFESILAEYGAPHFLKVDIEGLDALCVRALTKDCAPHYVSFESGAKDIDLIAHLRSIGYQRFAMVNQYNFSAVSLPTIGTIAHVMWAAKQSARRFIRSHPALHGLIKPLRGPLDYSDKAGFRNDSAGPSPMERSGGWQSIDEFIYTWSSAVEAGLFASSWFDIHASLM